VGSHRSSYARDVLHYTVTLVMLVRAATVQNRPEHHKSRTLYVSLNNAEKVIDGGGTKVTNLISGPEAPNRKTDDAP
jgi:hypothetical protein